MEQKKGSRKVALKSPVAKPRPPGAPVTLHGWLHKQGADGFMLWKRRWFVLSEYCLYYYKDPDEKDVLGTILLPSYRISPIGPEDRIFRKFAFKAEHANMRTYYFAADTHEYMVEWMNALSLAAILQNEAFETGRRQTLRTSASSSSTPLNRTPDEGDSGFHGSSSSRSLRHLGLNRDSSESLLDDSGIQPLYVNAPPKPRRLNSSVEESPDRSVKEMSFKPIQVHRHPPRPHSADFLEAELPNKPSRPSLSRPKSSLGKVDYSDYWTEEKYAEQMRQVVTYQKAFVPPVYQSEAFVRSRDSYQSGSSTSGRSQPEPAHKTPTQRTLVDYNGYEEEVLNGSKTPVHSDVHVRSRDSYQSESSTSTRSQPGHKTPTQRTLVDYNGYEEEVLNGNKTPVHSDVHVRSRDSYQSESSTSRRSQSGHKTPTQRTLVDYNGYEGEVLHGNHNHSDVRSRDSNQSGMSIMGRSQPEPGHKTPTQRTLVDYNGYEGEVLHGSKTPVNSEGLIRPRDSYQSTSGRGQPEPGHKTPTHRNPLDYNGYQEEVLRGDKTPVQFQRESVPATVSGYERSVASGSRSSPQLGSGASDRTDHSRKFATPHGQSGYTHQLNQSGFKPLVEVARGSERGKVPVNYEGARTPVDFSNSFERTAPQTLNNNVYLESLDKKYSSARVDTQDRPNPNQNTPEDMGRNLENPSSSRQRANKTPSRELDTSLSPKDRAVNRTKDNKYKGDGSRQTPTSSIEQFISQYAQGEFSEQLLQRATEQYLLATGYSTSLAGNSTVFQQINGYYEDNGRRNSQYLPSNVETPSVLDPKRPKSRNGERPRASDYADEALHFPGPPRAPHYGAEAVDFSARVPSSTRKELELSSDDILNEYERQTLDTEYRGILPGSTHRTHRFGDTQLPSTYERGDTPEFDRGRGMPHSFHQSARSGTIRSRAPGYDNQSENVECRSSVPSGNQGNGGREPQGRLPGATHTLSSGYEPLNGGGGAYANTWKREVETPASSNQLRDPISSSSTTPELGLDHEPVPKMNSEKRTKRPATLIPDPKYPTLARQDQISLDIKKSSLWSSYISSPNEAPHTGLSTSHDNILEASRKEEEGEFLRSKSARLPSKKSVEVKGNTKEESMTRLLEWKQRMLQSPLTKKSTTRSSDTSSPLSHTSVTIRSTSATSKPSQLTTENVATLAGDMETASVRSHSSGKGRRSRPASPSSDEDFERNRPVRRRSRRSNSSGKSRRSNDSTKTNSSPTTPQIVQPDYENIGFFRSSDQAITESVPKKRYSGEGLSPPSLFSDACPPKNLGATLKSSPENGQEPAEFISVCGVTQPSTLVRPKATKKTIWNESDIVKEFSYEYVCESPAQDEVASATNPKWIRNKFRTVEDLSIPPSEAQVRVYSSSSVNDSDESGFQREPEMKEVLQDSSEPFYTLKDSKPSEKVTYFGSSKGEQAKEVEQSGRITSFSSRGKTEISNETAPIPPANSRESPRKLSEQFLLESLKSPLKSTKFILEVTSSETDKCEARTIEDCESSWKTLSSGYGSLNVMKSEIRKSTTESLQNATCRSMNKSDCLTADRPVEQIGGYESVYTSKGKAAQSDGRSLSSLQTRLSSNSCGGYVDSRSEVTSQSTPFRFERGDLTFKAPISDESAQVAQSSLRFASVPGAAFNLNDPGSHADEQGRGTQSSDVRDSQVDGYHVPLTSGESPEDDEESLPGSLVGFADSILSGRSTPNFVDDFGSQNVGDDQASLHRERSRQPLSAGFASPDLDVIPGSHSSHSPSPSKASRANSVFENLYMPMTPALQASAKIPRNIMPGTLKRRQDEIYVEMSDDSSKRLSDSRRSSEAEPSHYDLLSKSSTMYEPVYMELPIHDKLPMARELPPTPKLTAPLVMNPRFSLSDTFRPASYYLGYKNGKIGPGSEHDSSDSDIVSPPPFPEVSHARSHSLDHTPREISYSDRRKPLTVVRSLQDILKDVSEDDLLVESVNTVKPETAWQNRKSFPNKFSPSHQRQGSGTTLVPLYENMESLNSEEQRNCGSQQSITFHQRSYSSVSATSSLSSNRDPGVPYYYSDLIREESRRVYFEGRAYLDGSTVSLRVLPNLPPESLALAADMLRESKTTGIDGRNIYESRARRAQTPDISADNGIRNGHEALRRARSLDGLADEQGSLDGASNFPNDDSSLWDEDNMWRANLRRASIRHVRHPRNTETVRHFQPPAQELQQPCCRKKRQPPIGRDSPDEERFAPVGASPESRRTPVGRDSRSETPARCDPTLDRRRRAQIDGYVWDENEEKFVAARKGAPIDRENLRQWDMLSSSAINWSEPTSSRHQSEVLGRLKADRISSHNYQPAPQQPPQPPEYTFQQNGHSYNGQIFQSQPVTKEYMTHLARRDEGGYKHDIRLISTNGHHADPRIHNTVDEKQRPAAESEGQISAGDLLGRTHEELVLLLIQLRRQAAALAKARKACLMEMESQLRLAHLDMQKREEHLAKVEEMKNHVIELEKQLDKVHPLINLVDNMVKLGTLYSKSSPREQSSPRISEERRILETLRSSENLRDRRMYKDPRVTSDHRISGDARISSNNRISGDPRVTGDRRISDDSRANADSQGTEDPRIRSDRRFAEERRTNNDRWVSEDNRINAARRIPEEHRNDRRISEDHRIQNDLRISEEREISVASDQTRYQPDQRSYATLDSYRRSMNRAGSSVSVADPRCVPEGINPVHSRSGSYAESTRGIPGKMSPQGSRQAMLEKEITHVHELLARSSKKLEETAHETSRLEREMTSLYKQLSYAQGGHLYPPSPEAQWLEEELNRVQHHVGSLQARRTELGDQIHRLVERSNTLKGEIRPGPTGVSGAAPVPARRPVHNLWQETDLDTSRTVDHGSPKIVAPSSLDRRNSRSFEIEEMYVNTGQAREHSRPSSFQVVLTKKPIEDLQTSFRPFVAPPVRDRNAEARTVRTVKREAEKRQKRADEEITETDPIMNDPVLSQFRHTLTLPKSKRPSSAIGLPISRMSPALSDRTSNGPRRSSSSRRSLTDTDSETSSNPSPLLSPIYSSAAAKAIVQEMHSGDADRQRRPVPKPKRRHFTISSTRPSLESELHQSFDSMDGRSRDDIDMERALRSQHPFAPDVVRSTIPKKTKFNASTIDRMLGVPDKIVIEERYVPDEDDVVSSEERLRRSRKAEAIKRMLSSTPSLMPSNGNPAKSDALRDHADSSESSGVKGEQRQREHLLNLNKIIAQQVQERSKAVAETASAAPSQASLSSDDDSSPADPLPLFQQRYNLLS